MNENKYHTKRGELLLFVSVLNKFIYLTSLRNIKHLKKTKIYQNKNLYFNKAKKRKAKRNRYFRKKRCESNPRLRSYKYRKILHKRLTGNLKPKQIIIDAPSIFNILEDVNVVLEFISDIKKNINYNDYIKYLSINMKYITSIDSGAIAILLSTIRELALNGIITSGNIPDDKTCKEFLEKSGFFKHVRTISNQITEFDDSYNLIIRNGKDKVLNEQLGNCIKDSMEFLTEEKKHYPPVYSMLIEMAGNSIEHGYIHQLNMRHWFLGVNFDENNQKVIFTFADNGSGILKTIHRKKATKYKELMLLKDKTEILNNVFEKKYGSRHKQTNRNKGLPVIKQQFSEGKILNLKVITNDVYMQYDSNNHQVLKHKFSGTFYYWELDTNCI